MTLAPYWQAALNLIDPPHVDVWTPLGYTPHPKQAEFHAIPAFSDGGPFDVLFGGAAGPGKTTSLLFDAIQRAAQHPGLEVWLVRATYPQIHDSFISRLEKLGFGKAIGARWNGTEHNLRLPNGSILKFRHARNVADAADMLSAECQYLIVDERTRVAPAVVDQLVLRVRSGDSRLPVIGVRSGTNPGGPGHSIVKAQFIDPAPLGREHLDALDDEGLPILLDDGRRLTRWFLPAKLVDNPSLDSSYKARLNLLPPDMRAAYRDGDWSKFEGMRFSQFDPQLHIVAPFEISLAERKGLGIDWGSSAPFAAAWGAKLNEQLVVYRELHQAGLTPSQQARLILSSEADGERDPGRPIPAWLDPSTWARSPEQPLAKPIDADAPPPGSIAYGYEQAGVAVRKAFNDRVAGWTLLDELLTVRDDGRPGVVFFSTCTNVIRSLTGAPRDPRHPEDVDAAYTDDHAADAARYLAWGLMKGAPSGLPRRRPHPHRNGDRIPSIAGSVSRMGF